LASVAFLISFPVAPLSTPSSINIVGSLLPLTVALWLGLEALWLCFRF
jgi:hypothetical protein